MLRSLTRPVLRPLVRALTEARDFFDPRQLFSNSSTIGAIYAYDDFSYLYQKSDGSTPVTALEQPVGLVVDKRWGGAVSATELVTNGTFTTDTAGWTASNATLSAVSGRLRVTENGVASFGFARQVVTTVVGRWYRLTVDVSNITATKAQIWVGTASGGAQMLQADNITTARTVTASFLATTTTSHVQAVINVGAGGTTEYADFDNISVRELPGLHAYQATDAARPTLKGTPRYANFDRVDDHWVAATGGGSTTGFMLAGSIQPATDGVARTIFSDRGTNTGYKVEIDATNKLLFTAGNGAAYTTCTGPTLTAGTNYAFCVWHDGANLNIKVGTAATVSQAFATATAGTSTLTLFKDNAAASGYFSGRLYALTYIRNASITDGIASQLIGWAASKGGFAP